MGTGKFIQGIRPNFSFTLTNVQPTKWSVGVDEYKMSTQMLYESEIRFT